MFVRLLGSEFQYVCERPSPLRGYSVDWYGGSPVRDDQLNIGDSSQERRTHRHKLFQIRKVCVGGLAMTM